ncbi:MAG: DnaJ domain-containing protein [Nodosilinea sp.]
MSQPAFSPSWLNDFTDPYAVLGVSVAADERRILKRYHTVAKSLHPDVQRLAPPEQRAFTCQVLPKLVNPAYQRLKQNKGRSEVLATLRFKVRRLSREDKLPATEVQSRHLLRVSEAEVDLFYEQALEQLCQLQYESIVTFETYTRQMGELNLVYLRRKMGDLIIREKRTGLVAAPTVRTATGRTAAVSPDPTAEAKSSAASYADRHFKRAQEYLHAKRYSAAIQELKDALRLDPQNSNYHCLIGQAYLLNKLPGMAKVHLKQALRFNPNNAIALKYARQLNIDLTQPAPTPTKTISAQSQVVKKGNFLGGMFSRP